MHAAEFPALPFKQRDGANGLMCGWLLTLLVLSVINGTTTSGDIVTCEAFGVTHRVGFPPRLRYAMIDSMAHRVTKLSWT
jgi:hypothetical protein